MFCKGLPGATGFGLVIEWVRILSVVGGPWGPLWHWGGPGDWGNGASLVQVRVSIGVHGEIGHSLHSPSPTGWVFLHIDLPRLGEV